MTFKPALLSLYAAVMLYPYWHTGYYFDDSFNSLLRNGLAQQGESLLDHIIAGARIWTLAEGRFFPLSSFFCNIVYYLATDLSVYRIIQLGLVIANLLAFYYWLLALRVRESTALLTTLLLPLLFQLRNYHDPIAGYAGLMQFCVGLGFATSWFVARGKAKWAWVTAALGLLTYEANIVFVVLAMIQAWRAPDRAYARKTVLGFTAVFGVYGVIFVGLRLAFPPHYTGTQFHFGWRILTTALFQASAALPLAYPIFGRADFVSAGTGTGSELWNLRSLAVLLLSMGVFGFALREVMRDRLEERRSSIFGYILFLLPAFLIGLSVKYQNEIVRPGHGYLFVYISYFGVAMLMGHAIVQWVQRRSRRKHGIYLYLALFLSAITTLNFTTNLLTAEGMNQYWKYPREILERAGRRGELQELCHERLVINGTDHYWVGPVFLYGYCGKVVEIDTLPNLLGQERGRELQGAPLLEFGTDIPHGVRISRYSGADSAHPGQR